MRQLHDLRAKSVTSDHSPIMPTTSSVIRVMVMVTLRVSSALAWGVVSALALTVPAIAQAAQTDIVISMTIPGPAPQIGGPALIAAKTATPFLYTVAATGAKPMSFAATGLPAGLSISPTAGTITGTAPAVGSYPMAVTVTNASGSVQRVLTLVVGDTLALTPPMGWNSYDSFGGGVTEAEVLAAATAQAAQLQPFGWNYVVVDFLWFDPEQTIDANGRFLPSITRFPSATGTLGFKPLADRVHAMGLNFGIHIMRGIPRKTVTANAPIAGSTLTATAAGNTADACPWDAHMWGVAGASAAGQAWYDSIFAQYAAWGIDFVKVDDMINNQVVPLNYHRVEVQAIRNAIDKSGRAIVLSLSPGPMQTADAVDLNGKANMWRMVNDFWDVNGLSTLADVFTASGSWQAVSSLGVGHWPDADMLPLGYLGPRVPVHAAGPTALTHNEQISVISLWAILPSPLMFGGNVPMLTTNATGPFTLALLTNDEVLAVNQDAGGNKAKRIVQSGTTEVWAKDLGDGRKAVALFNRGEADATVSVTLAQLGLTAPPLARDLWKRTDLGTIATTSTLTQTVPWRGAALITLTPPRATPDAGADSPVDTTPGTGGGTGQGGGPGGGGTSGGGGTGAGTGAGGDPDNTASGGTTGGGLGGTTGQGVGGSAMPTSPPSSSGCSCRISGGDTGGAAFWMVAFVSVGLTVVASRRRRSRGPGR
jgi:alpha-galactosidase